MVLKIYGFPLSSCVRRVAVIAKEMNVPYEVILVDVAKREHKSPAFLEKHPFGQVPYINDDGFELYESRAIARYLATKYAGQGAALIPTELKANALFEQAASFELNDYEPFAHTIAIEKVVKARFGGVPDEKRLAEDIAILESKLDAYERILSKQKYLAGNEITLADMFHLPWGELVFIGTGLASPEKRPSVYKWWKDISSRPTWLAVKDGA